MKIKEIEIDPARRIGGAADPAEGVLGGVQGGQQPVGRPIRGDFGHGVDVPGLIGSRHRGAAVPGGDTQNLHPRPAKFPQGRLQGGARRAMPGMGQVRP